MVFCFIIDALYLGTERKIMCQKLEQNSANQPCFRKVIGNTTYVVRVHFSETSKETMEDKVKRLIQEDVESKYRTAGIAVN